MVLVGCRSDGLDSTTSPTSSANASMGVVVNALPAGASAAITVYNSTGFRQDLTGPQLLGNLPPGSYTVVASDVMVGDARYTATPAVQTITVAAGTPVTVSIAYAPALASLQISIAGLPQGSAAAVQLSGPSGYGHLVTASELDTGLVAGTYQIAAQSVTINGDRYDPTPASQSLTLPGASNPSQVTVTYAVATGRLVIGVNGVPSGASAMVAVSGPGGYSHSSTQTDTLSGLVPGSYTISPSPLTANGQSYTATPVGLTVNVPASITAANATVTYAPGTPPTDNGLAVSIAGLPPGVAASVAVSGPGGFSEALTGSQTIAGLTPGNYTVTAANVVTGGYTYAPALLTQVVAVGSSAAVSVVYGVTTGSLALTINGASGASVTVSGPGGFSQLLSSSQTLTALVPGSYSISAASVVSGGFTYSASPANQTAVVSAGVTTPASVTYSSSTGDLALTISGAPTDVGASVVIAGPGGFSQLLTSSQQLSGLAPGSYTVTAANVSSSGYVYAPTVAIQTIAVTSGAVVPAAVVYAAATGTFTLTITGIPGGANAAVAVSGPGGFTASLTASQTLGALAPGTYTVTANIVATTDSTYTPQTANQSVTVIAGANATARVTYVAGASAPVGNTGALSVTITGSPTSALVFVTGPAGYAQLIGSTQTLTGLAAGSYTITASAVSSGGHTYVAAPATRSINVVAGSTVSAAFSYAMADGGLSVTVGGLPIGTSGSVTVTGPAGYSSGVTTSQTLGGLAPGSYTITAANVVAGGVTYVPNLASQGTTVAAGSTAAVTVTYSVPTGTIVLVMSGLPGGANGSVTVRGPGGYDQWFTASQTVTSLAPGTYTIDAGSVTSAGTSYVASPSEQTFTLVAGTAVTANVSYVASAPMTGGLAITISGVPASADVTVSGPAGYSHAVTATQTLTGLAPGNYTITAASVISGGSTYTPAPATQTITVSAGATAAASVVYSAAVPTTGGLTVTIAGSPVNASVTVTGPGGYSHAVTATQTLTLLTPGSYTITAATVVSGGTTYTPAPATQTITVSAGATAAASVVYSTAAPPTGALIVTISGSPVNASVTVTGPGGYSHALTATQTLSGLTPGSYTVASANVTSGSTTYAPQSASQTVSVTAGGTASANVVYSAQGVATLSPGFQARSMTLPVSAADSRSGFLTFDYQIYVPTGYTPTRAWPVILEASGTGEYGTDNQAQLRVGLAPHIAVLGEQAIVVFPQWRAGTSTANLRTLVHIQALMNTIAEVNADMRRIYMSGNSGGGFRTWEYLYKYPTLFAAGVVAAGGVDAASTGTVPTAVTALRTMPVWIFSADDDTTVPTVTYFTPIVTEWAVLGVGTPPAKHTLYHAIGGHQPTWDTAFADPATWTWLFAQHK